MVATPLRAVIDTNVVFEGLTKRGAIAGVIIDAWLADTFHAFATNALAYEGVIAVNHVLRFIHADVGRTL
jgi:predicted nucleic acid-binding protein